MPPRIRTAAVLKRCAGAARARAAPPPTTPWAPQTSRSLTTTPKLRQPAAAAAAAAPAPFRLPDDYVPPTKPPAARPPETRKSQLIRTYTSLLRTTPLMLFYEHNNLTAGEWAAVRRELRKALAAVPPPSPSPALSEGGRATSPDPERDVALQVLRARMFAVSLKIVEFFDPAAAAGAPATKRLPASAGGAPLVHDLSEAAYEAVRSVDLDTAPADSVFAQLAPYMTGPVAGLLFPGVWPAHLAAALSVLSPVPGVFPAPSRKKSPGYYDPACQSGLAKLRLMGGRVEGRVLDFEGVRWVGGIQGGLEGLRAQLVAVLQGAGLGVTSALEGAGRSLWFGLEGRRMMLEEEAKPQEAAGEGAEAGAKTE